MCDTPLQVDIRRPPDWFRPPDERILECLAARERHGNMTPVGVSRDGRVERVDISRQYAGRRLSTLAAAGLADEIDSALYAISERGQRVLTGELDASDVPNPDDADGSDSA